MKTRRLDSNGDSMFGRGPTGLLKDGNAVAQTVFSTLKLRLGEWFMDTTVGPAWMHQPEGAPAVLDQHFDEAFAASEFKRVILSVFGVASLLDFVLTVDRATRKATISAHIKTIYGDVQEIAARVDQ